MLAKLAFTYTETVVWLVGFPAEVNCVLFDFIEMKWILFKRKMKKKRVSFNYESNFYGSIFLKKN